MAHCVLPDLTLIAVFRANPGRRSQTRPYRSYFCIPQQSDPLSVPSVIGMLLIGTLCLRIEDSRPMAITGRMGFLVSHRTDCGLHRSRILHVPFSPPRTFTFRATCGAWVAHRHPAPVSTDDYRHCQTIQRLRHHAQPPVPSDSEHLVLHSLHRLIRSTGTAHSMDCRVVCRHLSAHIRTSGKLCPTHPPLHVPSLINPNPNII